MRRFIATVLLPLSLVPVAFAVPRVVDEHESFAARYLERGALPAPDVRMDAGRVRAYRDRVPVLVYHGINDDGNRWSVTQEQFARQMAGLRDAGYTAIDAPTYARFVRGEAVKLPPRPILITFDDGRLDAFRGADAVLARYDLQATMFAIAGSTAEASRTYLGPDELAEMERSERWDVQLHAGDGHKRVDAQPYYGALLPGEDVQTMGERVGKDLDQGLDELGEIVPDAELGDLFAVPYSDFGQSEGGDARVAVTSLNEMTERFDAVFVQHSRLEPTRRGKRGLLTRFDAASVNPGQLLRKLRYAVEKED